MGAFDRKIREVSIYLFKEAAISRNNLSNPSPFCNIYSCKRLVESVTLAWHVYNEALRNKTPYFL